MRKFLYCQPFGTWYIGRGVTDAGATISVPLTEIRAAVSWPDGAQPGYWCVFGKLFKKNPLGRSPLIFLDEGESVFASPLMESVTSAASKFRAHTIYADRGSFDARGWQGFYTDLYDYINTKNLNVDLAPAIAAEDEPYGIVLIQEYFRGQLLDIPKDVATTIMKQIREMTTETSDFKPFYAFKALRYLLAGFQKFDSPVIDELLLKRKVAPSADAWT